MLLSASNRDKLYEDLGKLKNSKKMLDLVNTVVYSVPINNGEEDEWFRQCDDIRKFINTKGLGKNGKIISWDQYMKVQVGPRLELWHELARNGR